MSLSDHQQKNKKKDLVGDGSNQFQTRSPSVSCVDDDFDRLISTEAAKESMKRQREWHALHSCARCRFPNDRCLCKVRAPRGWHKSGPSEYEKRMLAKDRIHEDDNALPPWLATWRERVLEETKDLDFSLLWSTIQKI